MLGVSDEEFDDVRISMTSVDLGLAGLELKKSQSMLEWATSCCCPCLAPKKANISTPKSPSGGAVMMQDFTKSGRAASTVEPRPSFHFSSEKVFFADTATDAQPGEEVEVDIDPELNKDIVAWEERLHAYELLEESLLGQIPPDTVKEVRKDPAEFLSSEDSAVVALASAWLALLAATPDAKGSFPQLHARSSQATLTRFMSLSADSTHDDSSSCYSRGRSDTLNPLHEGGEGLELELEELDEVVSCSQAGRGEGEGEPAAQRLSKRWAGHLSEIAPTQGKLSRQVDRHGEVVLKVRPKWPDWLTDVVFDVVKTNKFGRRQQRKLKLTKYHIVNIKEGTKVTRLHRYSALKHAYLVRPSTFVLEFFDDAQDPPLFYDSLVAGQVVQQISTRVQVRGALEDVSLPPEDLHSFSRSMSGVGFSVRATSFMVDAVSSDKYNHDSNVLEFARSLGALAAQVCASVGISVVESALAQEAQDRMLLSLGHLQTESREFRVKQAVEALVLSKAGPAGNTTSHFVEEFRADPAAARALLEVRHFIDGMHEYVLETNLPQLVALLRGSVAAPVRTRTASSNSNSSEQGQQQQEEKEQQQGAGAALAQDDVTAVSFIAFMVVEEAVFYPLQAVMSAQYFSDPQVLENEVRLVQKMRVLAERHQHEWSISPRLQSPAAWSSAVFELAGVERNPTPSLRLQALVHTAKAIYAEFKCEVLPVLRAERGAAFQDSDAVLGADDFLPIFIFVVCRAGLTHPSLSRDMLWQLCHPDQLHGESGYYLTVFESALEFIAGEEVSAERMSLSGVDADVVTTHSTKLTQVPLNPIRRLNLLK